MPLGVSFRDGVWRAWVWRKQTKGGVTDLGGLPVGWLPGLGDDWGWRSGVWEWSTGGHNDNPQQSLQRLLLHPTLTRLGGGLASLWAGPVSRRPWQAREAWTRANHCTIDSQRNSENISLFFGLPLILDHLCPPSLAVGSTGSSWGPGRENMAPLGSPPTLEIWEGDGKTTRGQYGSVSMMTSKQHHNPLPEAPPHPFPITASPSVLRTATLWFSRKYFCHSFFSIAWVTDTLR